jgi:tetratricopeptide (TPR) repeat protein
MTGLGLFAEGTAPATHPVSIGSDPPRASIFVDGQFVGVTPLKLAAVAAGDHFIKLTRHGYRNWCQVVRAPALGDAIQAKLVPLENGSVRISTEPAGASAFVDGEFRGKTPMVVGDLPAGRLPVRIEKNEYLPWNGEVEIRPGETATVEAALKSRIESFLLEGIQRHPEVVKNYTELGHFYMVRHDFDRALEVYAKGMDACVRPDAIPNDCYRHYNELRYSSQGTYLQLGDKETVQSLHERFIKLYEDGIRRTPGNERNYWALIEARSGKWEECVRLYEQALAHSRDQRTRNRNIRGLGSAMYQQACALQQQGKHAEALAAYEEVVKRSAPAPLAQTALTAAIQFCESTLKAPSRALALRRSYFKLFRDVAGMPELQIALARQLEAKADYATAIEEYRRFTELFPQNDGCPAAYVAIARIYATRLNEPEKAVEWHLACAKKHPGFDGCAVALKEAAELCDRLNWGSKAKRLRRQVVERYPRSEEAAALDTDPASKQRRTEAAELAAKAKALESTNLEGAIAAYEDIVRRFQQTNEALKAQIRLIALHQSNTKDFAREAAARLRQVELFPDDDNVPTWLMALAGQYAARNEHGKAIEVYQKVVKDYPESDQSPVAQLNIATTCHSTLMDQAKAAEEYRKLATDYPDHPNAPMALYQLGWIYLFHHKGKVKEGVAVYRELLEKYPFNSYADSVETWYDAFRTERPTRD